jgi:hypothetical protein
VSGSTPTLGTPGLCISGTNVYVFYVVTTTTTNTVITAPIVAANGPIDYVGGGISPVTPASTTSGSGGLATNGGGGPSTAGGVSCVMAGSAPGVGTKRVTCPGSSTARGVIRLLCSLSRGRRTAHIAGRHMASVAARSRTTKRKRARVHRNVYLCKRI